MVAPGVPHLAVVIPGGLRVPVVQHGVEGHLKGDVHRAGIRRRPAGMVIFAPESPGPVSWITWFSPESMTAKPTLQYGGLMANNPNFNRIHPQMLRQVL